MITLVITGVGGPLGQALIKAARASTIPCRIVGTDRSALSVGLAWTDSPHVIAGSAQPDEYLADMRRVCREESATLILPGSDSELLLLAEQAEALREATGAVVVASSPSVLKVGLDKCATATFLEANEVSFPQSAIIDDADACERLIARLGFPLIAKPCRGSGSRGVVKVRSREDIAYLRSGREAMILQEYLAPDDEEYTVAVYTQRDGRQVGSIAMKRELVAGNTYRAFVAQEPSVLAEAEAIVRALGAVGPCNVQLRRTNRGAVAFEINPRFSGTTAMRANFGFNEVEMAIRDFALAEAVPEPVIRPGVALRFWDEVYLPAENTKANPSCAESRALAKGVLRVLGTNQADEWMSVLRNLERHDFYFLPAYHALAEKRGEGEARLFVYEQNGYSIALPLMLRAIADLPELASAAGEWRDATSVYGYAGPLASRAVPHDVQQSFQAALEEALHESRVVSAFSRLHPLFEQKELLREAGECQPGGHTVSIDLTQSDAEQTAQYRRNVRSRIHQLRDSGFSCAVDPTKRHLPDFINIYYETMRRVGAQEGYFFEEDYFLGLAEKLGDVLQLFVVRAPNEEILGGGLFTICDRIVQYHLGGTRDTALKLSPTALLFNAVRLWGKAQGAETFHLGGGLGGSADSLFRYKAGFSHRQHEFATWRWVIAPEVYGTLRDARHRWLQECHLEASSHDYFPAYRGSARPRVELQSAEFLTTVTADAQPPVLTA